ncbi:FAD-binding protein [Chloroflexota bacterium]
MAKLERLGTVIETDILVIGGGSSGLWAAKRAREFSKNVLIIDKGPSDWGGLAAMSGGDFDAVVPEESVEDWVQDFVYYYDGLCEQDLMEVLLKQSYARMKEYESFGCEFKRTPDGKLKGVSQRGLEHVKLYPARFKGRGGEDMMKGLVKKTIMLGVKRMSRTLITDLLTWDDKVVGAVGFNTYNGKFHIFKARAIILTTGQPGWKHGYLQSTMTAEGSYMAYRAGAELRNFEFLKVWNVPRLFSWEGQTTLLPLGARFVNALGEDFMAKYCPSLGANTDPHYNVVGMCIEANEGRAPIYFDTSKVKQADVELLKPQLGWQLMNYDKLVELGIDFFTQNTEWMPQVTGSFGGLVADLDGRTRVPGLFTAGRNRSIEPGVYTGGFALCTTATSGYITGKAAAEYASSNSDCRIDEEQVVKFKKRLYAKIDNAGISPYNVLCTIREVLFSGDVCIMKTEKSLKDALIKLGHLKNEILPKMKSKDAHYLMKHIEVEAMVFATELYLRTSLLRKESRAGHYRVDYPERDNENWLKWIIISGKNGDVNLRTEPVPFEKYKYKPTRYYMDLFRFPKQPR